jgi:hypothetical protein
VADFNLAATITADGSQAVSEVGRVENSITELGGAEERTAKSAKDLARETREAANAEKELDKAAQKLKEMLDPAAAAQDRLNNELKEAKSLFDTGRISATQYAQAQQKITQGSRGVVTSVGQQRAGMQQLGVQFGDFTQQLALGTPLFLAFGQQAGQAAGAAQMMGGTLGRVGAFMAGPWGALILAATVVLGGLASKLFDTEEAAKAVESASDGLADAQGVLGKMFDLTSGSIEHQNELLRVNAQLMAIRLRDEALEARERARETREGLEPGIIGQITGGPGAVGSQIINSVRYGGLTPSQGIAEARRLGAPKEVLEYIRDVTEAQAKEQMSGLIVQSLNQGRLAPELRRDANTRTRTPRDTSAAESRLAEFGQDAASRIAALSAEFGDAPTQVDKVNKALASLDDLLEDIQEKKPPNFKELLEDGARARTVIQDGINKPWDDFIEKQEESLAVSRLIARGRDDEAAALRIIQGLEKTSGTLTIERKDAVLATVQALKAEQRAAEILQEKQEKYRDALAETKSLVSDFFTGNLDKLTDIPKRLFQSFKTLQGRIIEEQLFGDIFRELEDEITGNNVARDAADRMAEAVDKATVSIDKLGSAAENAAAGVSGSPMGEEGADIVVTGSRPGKAYSPDALSFFSRIIGKLGEGIFGRRGADAIGRASASGVADVLDPILGKLGTSVQAIGQAMPQFAAAMAVSQGLNKILGIHDPTGGFLGPLGALAVNSFIHDKRGSATITNVDSDAVLTGNSKKRQGMAGGLAGSVQDALRQISGSLGGTLGDFKVSIGVREDQFRVDTTGGGRTKKGKVGVYDFDKDQEAAITFAIMDAIKDGAVKGLSAAVQKAIGSNDDLNKALEEALKVQEVETLLGGFGAQLENVFKDFERQAQERVRIAKQYGFDLVELEEINAKERAALFEDVLTERIGGLRSLLNDMTLGGLFEGTPMQQRSAILGEIGTTRTQALAGEEGAAQRLADLERQLLEVSRSAFGTAGPEYAGDRAAAVASAQEIIRMETERARAAQEAATAALNAQTQQVQLQNEANDLAAQGNATLSQIRDLLGQVGFSGSSGINNNNVGRAVNLGR